MKPSLTKPALFEPLSVVLPTEEQTWLLRACLWSGEAGRDAWTRWRERVDDPIRLLRLENEGTKGLLPLLFVALRDTDVTVDKAFQTCLRTAYLRDELRGRLYRQICRDVLSAFTTAAIPAIVLKGAALADTVYRDPVLQHAHYLDVLLKEEDLHRATGLLPSLGFARISPELDAVWQGVEIEHRSGLPLVLNRHLFSLPFYHIAIADVWARSQLNAIADVPARLLSPADNLLHVCGHAFYSERHESLRWVCDSWFLIACYPPLDWDVLVDCAQCHHLALPLSVTLGYLAEELKAPVPETVLERLYAAASRTDKIGREAALFGARASARGGFKRLIQMARDWRARAFIIQWMIFPSSHYVRWRQNVRDPRLLPCYYMYRPLKYIARRVWRRGRNCARRRRESSQIRITA